MEYFTTGNVILGAIASALLLLLGLAMKSAFSNLDNASPPVRSKTPRPIKTKPPRPLPGRPGYKIKGYLGQEIVICPDGKFDLTSYHINDLLMYAEMLLKAGAIDQDKYKRIIHDFTRSNFSDKPLDRELVKQRVKKGFPLDPCVAILSEAGLLSNSEREYLCDIKIPEIERKRRFGGGDDDGGDIMEMLADAKKKYEQENAG